MIIENILFKRTGLSLYYVKGLRGSWLDPETHLVVIYNVADKIMYPHGQINSSSHTLP